MRHMLYGSFWTQNSMVIFFFLVWPEERSTSGQLWQPCQIRSNFIIQNFPNKICLYCAVLSQDSQKMSFIYMHDNYKCQKLHLKMWRPHLVVFFGHCTAKKNNDFALKFCMPAVCMYFDHIFSFFDKLKMFDFIGNYFLKI